MNQARTILALTLLPMLSVAGQESVPQSSSDSTSLGWSASRIVVGGARRSNVGRDHVPRSAFVRLVSPLSGEDVLTIYEMGNWSRYWQEREDKRAASESSDPDTRLIVSRGGKTLFRYALKNRWTDGDEDWGVSLVAMKAVHLCSDTVDVTYLVFQTGNQGGLFMALLKTKAAYQLVEVSDAGQGRMILSASRPEQVEVWTSHDSGACTACPKQFIVKKLELSNGRYRLVSQFTTKKLYRGFQDSPLVLEP